MSDGWQDQAACKGKTDLFFSGLPQRQATAIAICATCPVRPECRKAGAGEPFGVWGGIAPPKQPRLCLWCKTVIGSRSRPNKKFCSTRCLYAAKDAVRRRGESLEAS